MRILNRLPEYSDEAIIAELKRLADTLGKSTLSVKDLNHARLSYATLKNRFGGLRRVLKLAGLSSPSFNRNLTDDQLLEELKRIWDIVLQVEGRRPFKDDLVKYKAKFSQGPYYRRWGSWIKACEAMLIWEEQQLTIQSKQYTLVSVNSKNPISPRPKRPIALRLRYQVLKRDNFKCTSCGRSPSSNPGLQLHVDHKVAESRGGEAVIENLATLCSDCNLGKSNS